MVEPRGLARLAAGLFALVGCSREPLPSPEQDVCAAVCESVACLESELGPDTVRDCEVYCLGKFEVSEEQAAGCHASYTDAMECLAELTCGQYESWLTEDPDAPCASARAKVEAACEGIYLEPYILPP
jgi:hypothetical protein